MTETTQKPRLAGVDLARALALIGMVGTHTFELATADGTPLPAALLAGKASALFAVLAGFSITLSTRSYDRTANAVKSLLIRAAFIIGLGLILGSITSNIAIILVNYGLLFALAIPVFRLPTRALAWMTPLWLVGAPIIGFAVRHTFELDKAWDMPHMGNFTDLQYMGEALFLTGYFPVLEWFGYILLGLLLSRLDWTRTKTAVTALAGGITAAVIAPLLSSALLRLTTGMETLIEATSGVHPKHWGGLENALYVANSGTTPTDTWWWLAIAGPHSSTPLDMVLTAGTSTALIAAATLLCQVLRNPSQVLSPLMAAGSMSLTLYTIHVVLREFSNSFLLHTVILLTFAWAWKVVLNQQGPLERTLSEFVKSVAPKRTDAARPGTVGKEPPTKEEADV